MTHEALPLQIGQHGERRLERSLGRVMNIEHAAQVDDIQRLMSQMTEIVVHRLSQFLCGP